MRKFSTDYEINFSYLTHISIIIYCNCDQLSFANCFSSFQDFPMENFVNNNYETFQFKET